MIFSPIIALDKTFTVELNDKVSKVGWFPLTDSYIDNTLTTSGTFNDIS